MRYIAILLFSGSTLFGGWTGPVDIFTTTGAIDPVVGVDRNGNAVIIATATDDNTTYYIKYAQLISGTVTNLGNFSMLDNAQGANSIYVNSAGNAAAVWIEAGIGNNFTRGSVLLNGSWTTPVVLSDPINFNVNSSAPGINLNSLNNALAVWLGYDGVSYDIQYNKFISGWEGVATVFSDSSHYLTDFVFAGSPTGQGLAFWSNQDTPNVQAAYYNGNNWSLSGSLSSSVLIACGVPTAVAMNASNEGIFLWENSLGGISSSFFSNGVYSSEQTVYTVTGSNIVYIAVCLSGSGVATALWVVQDNISGNFTLLSNSSQSGGAWGSATPLVMPTSTFIGYPNIAVDNFGNVYAVWENDDGSGNGFVYYDQYGSSANSWLAGGPVLLSSLGHSSTAPNLAISGFGAATVVWVEDNITVQAVYMGGAPSPVSGFVGRQLKNRFLTATDRVNVLNWQASVDLAVVSYNLTRNGILIATIPATASPSYQDHNQSKGQKNTYGLIAIDVNGEQSTPMFVTVP